MLGIMVCEQGLLRMIDEGKVSGFYHSGRGQEAVAVGACSGLGRRGPVGEGREARIRSASASSARGRAQELSLGELTARLRDVAERARSGSLTQEDVSGGGVTRSHLPRPG